MRLLLSVPFCRWGNSGLETFCKLSKITSKYDTTHRESHTRLHGPGAAPDQLFTFPRTTPWGRGLVTTPRPMVLCAPALPLARPVGSFFKLRRRVVAQFPGFRAETRFVIPRLGLVRGRRRGQSRFLVDSGFRRHASTRQGWRAPRSAPAAEPLHAPRRPSPWPGLLRGQSWRLSRIRLRRRKMKRGRTSRWWWDAGRASLQGSEPWALLPGSFLRGPRRGILFAIFWRNQTSLFLSFLRSVREMTPGYCE